MNLKRYIVRIPHPWGASNGLRTKIFCFLCAKHFIGAPAILALLTRIHFLEQKSGSLLISSKGVELISINFVSLNSAGGSIPFGSGDAPWMFA
jgi:hypothetical protein